MADPTTVSAKQEYSSDLVHCTFSDGENEILIDIAADANPLPADSGYTIEDFKSQFIKRKTVTNEHGKETLTITIVYNADEYALFRKWKDETTSLTYTVEGLTAEPMVFDDVYVRVSETPSITPDKTGNLTYSVEVNFAGDYRTAAEAAAGE